MSPHSYTEDQLVEQPAIGLFADLGWTTVSALEDSFVATGTLQRETKGEVAVLVNEENLAEVYTATWDASHMPSGVYFYRLTAGSYTETKKLVLAK